MTSRVEVSLVGWRRGIRSVSLIELIRGTTTSSLTEAKGVLDRLLDGQVHSFVFTSAREANAFSTAAEELGALTEIKVYPDDMPNDIRP
jgi:hypothetical protein